MKTLKRKSLILSLVVLIAGGLGSISFVESYFEISKNLDIFSSLYRDVNTYYVDETNPGELVKTGIDAMLKSLDPYTNYIPEADIEDFRFMTTGAYGGIGALIRKKGDYVMIAEPYEDSPVLNAGLKAGDLILEVDGVSAKGKNSADMSQILRGQSDSDVEIIVERPTTGEKLNVKLKRKEIKVKDVPYYGMLDDKAGYITLTGFTETASREVKDAFNDLKGQGMQQLVFDLRGNGGGLLREAVNITNFFIDRGETVVETKGRTKEWDRTHKAINSPLDKEIPLVVLIDGRSASASEIVSGTLQDLDRAVIVGQTSFGKGLVQQTFPLSYNAQLKATVAKYYTPSGRCIQRIDYSHRDERGKANAIADSLTTDFETRNGRIVKDGTGISPDLFVEDDDYSDLLAIIVSEGFIFDFATDFEHNHAEIADAGSFHLDDAQYQSFIDYCLGQEFEYKNSSKEMLKELKETIKEDEFWEEVESEYTALAEKLARDKKEDMMKFRKEISLVLENEIVSRYYYRKGRIEASLASDKDVKKALDVLGDKDRFSSVLSGTCDDCLVKKG